MDDGDYWTHDLSGGGNGGSDGDGGGDVRSEEELVHQGDRSSYHVESSQVAWLTHHGAKLVQEGGNCVGVQRALTLQQSTRKVD